MVKSKKFVLQNNYNGAPKRSDFKLVEFDLPDNLKENEILLEAVFLTVDPYMRLVEHFVPYPPPFDMIGEQVAKVIRSRNSKFPINTLVVSQAGWKFRHISDGTGLRILPDFGGVSPSIALGVAGMPGATASIGLGLMEPKAGETIVVNGAGGAVGSVVAQLAKIKGLKVIAFAGRADKVAYLKGLGLDHVFNYKEIEFSEAITKVAPKGVELFFDNIGGDNFNAMINVHLKKLGRATLCGSIGTYNDLNPKLYPSVNFNILGKGLRIQGIQSLDYLDQFPAAIGEISEYLKRGQIKNQETVINGFDNMVEAFLGLFTGQNIGKMIVKA